MKLKKNKKKKEQKERIREISIKSTKMFKDTKSILWKYWYFKLKYDCAILYRP